MFVSPVEMCSSDSLGCGRNMAAIQGLAHIDQSSCNRIVLLNSLAGPIVERSVAPARFHNIFLDVFCNKDWFVLFQTGEGGEIGRASCRERV